MLRKKVVMLETAESDNDRLRKEMSIFKMYMQEEKSKFELDFMNQLSEAIRENAIKMEEITGQLQESKNVNRALSEHLKPIDPGPKVIEKRFQDLEPKHENQLSQLTNESNREFSEVERMRRQLHDAEKSRDDLFKKLEESRKSLNDLKQSTNDLPNSTLKKKSEMPTICRAQKARDITRFEDENRSLKSTVALLEKENNEITIALNDYNRKKLSDSDGNEKDTVISKLEKEIQTLRNSAMQMEKESRDLKNSSRNESSAEQSREFGRSPSPSSVCSQRRQSANGEMGISENRTSRIIQQLQRNLKNDAQKKKSSFIEIKTQTANGKSSDTKSRSLKAEETSPAEKLETERKNFYELQKDIKNSLECYKSQISELEAELLSAKDILAREKDTSRKQKKDLDSKLEVLHDTLSNSESSRAALALDKERLIAEKNRITEKKIQLEQKAKHQHQQLKQLQKIVDDNLNKVENTHKSDKIQIRCLRDQVESLKTELLRSQDQVSQLNKTLKEKEESESTVDDLARRNVQSLYSQMNKLQKESTLRHMELSEVERTYKKEINVLEKALESAHLELGENMKERDKEIERLKGLSEEKHKVSQRLEIEKEQLVLSMQDMMKNRRGEVDDLQNEILEMNAQLANETRGVSSLKSKLEQSKYQTKEMGRLRERVTELSRQLAVEKHVECHHGDSALEKENRELRRKLKEVSTERLLAEQRLQKYGSDRGNGGSSKLIKVLRERNASLKCEVEKLTRRLKKMSEKLSQNSTRVEI